MVFFAVSAGRQRPCKEHMRNVMKSRRDLESQEFAQLAKLLPLPPEVASGLDKGTVLRLTIAYMRTNNIRPIADSQPDSTGLPGVGSPVLESDLLQESLGGFFTLISQDGSIIYVSNHVTNYIGYEMHEMIGESLSEFVPEEDMNCFRKQFQKRNVNGTPSGDTSGGSCAGLSCEFEFRIKYKVVGSSGKTKRTGYMTMQCVGKVRLVTTGHKTKDSAGTSRVMVAVCRPSITPCRQELTLHSRTFMLRIDLTKGICSHCEESVSVFLGYDPKELIGSNIMEMYDSELMDPNLIGAREIWKRGLEATCLGRLRHKAGDWVWVYTREVLVFGANKQPLFATALNTRLSEDEYSELAKHRPLGTPLLEEGSSQLGNSLVKCLTKFGEQARSPLIYNAAESDCSNIKSPPACNNQSELFDLEDLLSIPSIPSPHEKDTNLSDLSLAPTHSNNEYFDCGYGSGTDICFNEQTFQTDRESTSSQSLDDLDSVEIDYGLLQGIGDIDTNSIIEDIMHSESTYFTEENTPSHKYDVSKTHQNPVKEPQPCEPISSSEDYLGLNLFSLHSSIDTGTLIGDTLGESEFQQFLKESICQSPGDNREISITEPNLLGAQPSLASCMNNTFETF